MMLTTYNWQSHRDGDKSKKDQTYTKFHLVLQEIFVYILPT